MKSPTRQSKRQASRRGEVRARLAYEVRNKDGAIDLFRDSMAAQNAVETAEEYDLAASMSPVFVLPADAESVERMAAQIRRAIIDNESDSPEIILAALGLNLTPTKP